MAYFAGKEQSPYSELFNILEQQWMKCISSKLNNNEKKTLRNIVFHFASIFLTTLVFYSLYIKALSSNWHLQTFERLQRSLN